MFKKNKLATTILSLSAASLSGAAQAQLEEVIVTATKRAQSAQDIPVAVSALSSEGIKDLNVGNFDDYLRFLPNLTSGGRGPGQSTIYVRGMAVEPITVMLSGAQGSVPNVALYLDEQPVTAPGRNLDVYAADLERVEVLAGPQGTLFGASSQAGTVRLITNKPDPVNFDAGFDASVGATKDGSESYTTEAFINVPVIENVFALRGAFYNVHRGGYIDNVRGTFTTDPSINPDSAVGAGYASYETADNSQLAEEDFNDSGYLGFRIGGKWFINENWDVLVQHTRQQIDADGVFDYDPEVGDLEVERFFPDELEDDFNQTAWTVEGRLNALSLLYTGAYLDREVQQSIDYTGYNNAGGFIDYYTCTYSNPDYIVNYGIDPQFITPGGRECKTPVKGFIGQQDHTRTTHEFRINTPEDQALRLTAGVFYDDVEIETLDDFYYTAVDDIGFAPNAPISTARNIDDSTRPPEVAFFNDITRTEEQIAVFGELTYDITSRLSATLGLRWYDLETDYYGSSNFADGIFQGSVNTDRGRDYDVSGGHTDEPLEEDDIIPKVNVSYTWTDDVLVYATYAEGFRPGGWNRGGGLDSINPSFPTVSATYGTDDVESYEIGWKSQLLGGNLQFNGNVYYIEWTDMQVSRFDPVNVSILTFIENAADSEILGLEADAVWLATQNLTLFAAFSYNDTELTAVKGQAVEIAPVGSQLPLTPEFQGTLRARYEWDIGDYQAYWQLAGQYAGKSYSSIVEAEREEQDSYATLDASVGIVRDQWRAELYLENMTDERAELYINNQDDIRRITTNRPATLSFKVSYRY